MKNLNQSKKDPIKENIKNNDLHVQPASNAAVGLRELFVDSLKDIYWAENALIDALPKMAANATEPSLVSVIKEHHVVTQNQLSRLKKVFELLGEKVEGKKCEAMAGLLKEGTRILQETIPGAVRDSGIIAASQKIEHYEIATYGTLVALAKALGENDCSKLLSQSLAEEKESDCILSNIALNAVNSLAIK